MGNKKLFFFLWLGCLLGAWFSLPYQYFLLELPPSTSYISLFLYVTLEEGILSAIACWSSYKILSKIDLKPFKESFKRMIYPGVISGFLAAMLTRLLLNDQSILAKVLARSPAWAGVLASVHAAINQEVFYRLFLLSLIFFLTNKLCHNQQRYRPYLLWTANIISSLIFALLHLIGGFAVGISSNFEIFQVIWLNGFISLVFGWLFFSKGFWAASIAHLTFALVFHGLFA